MRTKTPGRAAIAILAIVAMNGCRAIAGTAVLGTAVVVGTAGLAGYTVYKGGEAVASAAGAAGRSTKEAIVVSRGTLKAKCKYSVSELYPAAETVLKRAGFTDVHGKRDALAGILNAKTSFKEDVIIEMKLIDKKRTAVEILVGSGNLRQSEYLYDRMLGTAAARKKGAR